MNDCRSGFFTLRFTLPVIIMTVVVSGCIKQDNPSPSAAGDRTIFSADGICFTMAYVPGKRFYTGTEDTSTAAVKKGFRIGETEVTYELWNSVCTWAVANGGYTFANPGMIGSSGTGSIRQPVTTLNWRDAMVWCNALTEWLSAVSDYRFPCVYKSQGRPIRDARGNNGAVCDTVVPDLSAGGFRLPTMDEWELAARYRGDGNRDGDITDPDEYYPGTYSSGAASSWRDEAATNLVAVFHTNATAPVKSKMSNAIGLYDMSGNVDEWCFDRFSGGDGIARLSRGGSWISPADCMQIGIVTRHDPHCEYFLIGFRIVQTG